MSEESEKTHTFALVLLDCESSSELILVEEGSAFSTTLLASPEPEGCAVPRSAMLACTPVACVLTGKLLFSAFWLMLSAGADTCKLCVLCSSSCATDVLASAETPEGAAGSSPFIRVLCFAASSPFPICSAVLLLSAEPSAFACCAAIGELLYGPRGIQSGRDKLGRLMLGMDTLGKLMPGMPGIVGSVMLGSQLL